MALHIRKEMRPKMSVHKAGSEKDPEMFDMARIFVYT